MRKDPSLTMDDIIDTPYLLSHIPRWPIFVHFAGGVLAFSSASFYHLFYIVSPRWNEVLSRLDYGGISILIMGSSYAPYIYAFSCKPVYWVRDRFIVLITVTSIISFLATMSPTFN